MRLKVLFVCLWMTFISWSALAETKTLTYTNFSEVAVGSGMRLTVNQGNAYQVTATGDSADLGRLEVKQAGNRLEFSMRFAIGAFFRSGPISLNITMPALRRLDLSGGSNGRITLPNASQTFEAALSGGSELEGNLKTKDIELTLSGGSRATLSGSAEQVKLAGSGGSRYLLRNFAANNAEIDLSGGSNVAVTLNGRINSNLSGGSEVTYYGNAVMGDVNTSGGSRVVKGS